MTKPYLSLKTSFIPHKLRYCPFVWRMLQYFILHLRWKPKAFKKVADEYHLTLPKYSIDFMDGDWNFITTYKLFVDNSNFSSNYIQAGHIISLNETELSSEVLSFIKLSKEKGKKIAYFAMGSSSNK